MGDTTSLSALPSNNNSQSSENITLQTNEISSQGGGNSSGQPVQAQMQAQIQAPQQPPVNMKQANPPQYVPPNSQQQPPPQLSQNMINQVINGIQEASKTGVTELPSRDIPINPGRITQDEQVQPNFVPGKKCTTSGLYKKTRIRIEVESKQIRNEHVNSKLDNLYDEIQTPYSLVLFYISTTIFGKFIEKFSISLYK